MELKTASITNLQNLLNYYVSTFTSAEIELKNALPEWTNKAGSVKFKTMLQKYLDYVEQHIQKLESFAEDEKVISIPLKNRVMTAFIEETKEKLSQCSDAEVRDACLLACIQLINHFKISSYGTAASFARALSIDNYALVFHEAEVNEKQIDDRLSQLAEHEINLQAIAPLVLPG